MILRWGNFAFDDHENWFTIHKEPVRSEINQRQHFREWWIIGGVRKATTLAELETKVEAVETALSSDYRDLKFEQTDGTETKHNLLNADTVSGTRVSHFEWIDRSPHSAKGSGVEYVFVRSYQFVIEGDVLDSFNGILLWHESVRGIGDGGTKWRFLGSLTGSPQKQDLQLLTPFRTIQTGYAVGHLGTPVPASPLWPNDLHTDEIELEERTPRFAQVRNTEFPFRWKYTFESTSQLVGGPTLIF